jgi:hypothetical protein
MYLSGKKVKVYAIGNGGTCSTPADFYYFEYNINKFII